LVNVQNLARQVACAVRNIGEKSCENGWREHAGDVRRGQRETGKRVKVGVEVWNAKVERVVEVIREKMSFDTIPIASVRLVWPGVHF
jgi:hypothetical protein